MIDLPWMCRVVRRPIAVPARRVLLTTDLSELSAAVHGTALDTVDLGAVAPRPPPLGEEVLERAAPGELEAFLRDRGAVRPHVEPVVRTGIAADEIVAEARDWEADLLVVGTHARGWARG